MEFRDHVRVTGGALKDWLVATGYDALAVGGMWLVGLLIIGVPWAPLWAVLGGLFQFVPQFGPVFGLIMPAIVGAISGGWERLIYVLILYAVIVVVDGLVLQPVLMRRRARVPIWASILAPLVLGFFLSFWGVLIAAPLLAVIFAYRQHHRRKVGDLVKSDVVK
ncbi:MAG: AI-2E family transporter [Terriglobales bacterium]